MLLVDFKNTHLWSKISYVLYVKIMGLNLIMAEYVPEMNWFLEYVPEYHIRANGILVISERKQTTSYKNVTKESKKFDKDLCEDHLGASATLAMSVFTMLCVQDHPQHD